jgi:metal-responsive CopG/Arc/MetJ family transcriptional regulator
VARTHVILSEEVLEAIDQLFGKRGRSRFLEQAAREKLDRDALRKALDESFGIATGPRYEHWKDLETVKEWVRRVRRGEPVPPP